MDQFAKSTFTLQSTTSLRRGVVISFSIYSMYVENSGTKYIEALDKYICVSMRVIIFFPKISQDCRDFRLSRKNIAGHCERLVV